MRSWSKCVTDLYVLIYIEFVASKLSPKLFPLLLLLSFGALCTLFHFDSTLLIA
jgi:hypothetical protein